MDTVRLFIKYFPLSKATLYSPQPRRAFFVDHYSWSYCRWCCAAEGSIEHWHNKGNEEKIDEFNETLFGQRAQELYVVCTQVL